MASELSILYFSISWSLTSVYGMGNVVDYIDNLFPRLFNIFEIADVETPGCRSVSAYALPYSIIDISND